MLSSHWFQTIDQRPYVPAGGDHRRGVVAHSDIPVSVSLLEVYVGSVGPGVQWDPVTENHVVPVLRQMCKYTIIPCSSGPIEHRVPLNPRIPLVVYIGAPLNRSPPTSVGRQHECLISARAS